MAILAMASWLVTFAFNLQTRSPTAGRMPTMSDVVTPPYAPVLLMAGMHRSGTSLTSSLCQSGGLFIGESLNPPDKASPLGHFEDLDFLWFHERTLVSNSLAPTGFDITDNVPQVSEQSVAEAHALVAKRRGLGVPWGWKDPRATMFLEFWAQQIPDAKFLLVFRKPWEVADSLFRRGDTESRLGNEPLRALKLWQQYNALILKFAKAHPSRVLVREFTQLIASPSLVFADIRSKLWIPLADPRPLYRDDMPHIADAPIQECLVAMGAPECLSLYAELQALSGSVTQPVGSAGLNAVSRSVIERAFAEWSRSSAPAEAGEPIVGQPDAAILPIGTEQSAPSSTAVA